MPQWTRLFAVVAFAAAPLASLLMWRTYPLNVGAYDYPNYLRMMADGTSNLIHASGYPAILHGLLELLGWVQREPILQNGSWLASVQRIQNVVHLALFSVSLGLCSRVFGVRVAAVAAIGWGTNVLFLSNVNAAAPEWLQGHLVLLSLLLVAWARSLRLPARMLVEGASAAVYAGAYLVKYNSLMVAPAILALLLLPPGRWLVRGVRALAYAATVAALVLGYAYGFHATSTGTAKLSFDHTWVLTTALPSGYFQRDPSTLGIWSLRYLALCVLTPPDYGVAGAFPTVDWGAPPDVRQTHAATFTRIMETPRDELIALVRERPLPAAFTNFVSSIPLYYYYGLERTEVFGPRVYLEALRDMAGHYLIGVPDGLWHVFGNAPAPQVVPTPSNPVGSTFGSVDSFGHARLDPPADLFSPHFAQYYHPSRRVWQAGTQLVDQLLGASSVPWMYFILNLLAAAGLIVATPNLAKAQAALLAFALLSFVAGSIALIGLRSKEVVAIVPTYFVVWSLGLNAIWERVRRAAARAS